MNIKRESTFGLLVFGGSTPGVAAAITAARLGTKVALVSRDTYFGGLLASLGAFETHYLGVRSPFMEELKKNILKYYRETYGEESPQVQTCVNLEHENPMFTFEPSVCLKVIKKLLEAEENITIFTSYEPISVTSRETTLECVNFKSVSEQNKIISIRALTHIDASYEGDLVATAGIPYKLGREDRSEYGEIHAGRLFTSWVRGRFPIDAAEGRLNLLPKSTTFGLMNGSSGIGDNNIQAYSMRLCLTNDPHNRFLPAKPQGYDRTKYLAISQLPEEVGLTQYALHYRFILNSLSDMIDNDHLIHGHQLPNAKRSWNATNFPGGGKHYPEGSAKQRAEIVKQHVDHALSILYFLQTDETVPEATRINYREWGLAKDEFEDNNNIPYHMYIREARRIIGRYFFTQHDGMLSSEIARTPVHSDSIAITEFPLDSLACTTERVPGSLPDGQFFLMELSRPGQIPYCTLLTPHFDNMLVPVCASVSHVAWGTVRQTPTLIQMAEACGIAAHISKNINIPVGELNHEVLQLSLIDHGLMLTFFNEFDMSKATEEEKAMQFLGTKGFFTTYDARPNDLLNQDHAALWIDGLENILNGTNNSAELARKIHKVSSSENIGRQEFELMLSTKTTKKHLFNSPKDEYISRAQASLAIFRVVQDSLQ